MADMPNNLKNSVPNDDSPIKRKVTRVDPGLQIPLFFETQEPAEPVPVALADNVKFFDNGDQNKLIVLKEHLKSSSLGDVFIIDALLNNQDWSDFESAYKPGGRSPYAPKAMVAIILYGLMHGVSSLRKLERMARDSLGCLWLSGGIMPDHSVIGRFIDHHADILTLEFFESLTLTVLRRTHSTVSYTAGDGTVIEAAASRYKTIRREALKKQIDKTQQKLEEIKVNEEIDRNEIAKTNAHLERLLKAEQCLSEREAKTKIKGRDPKRVQINPQELDAVNQPLKQQGYGVSYKPGVIVNDKRVIVGIGVDASSEPLVGVDLLAQAARFGALTESSWDAGYSCKQMLEQEAQHAVSLLIPEGSSHKKDWSKSCEKQYPKSRFEYDASTDTYRCPTGQLLKAVHTCKGTRPYTQYKTKSCQSCEQREKCTKSKQGRSIKRYESDHLREAMREKLKDESVRERYRKRSGWVEPIFSHLKEQQGLTRFRRKGLRKVRVEFALHALAYNLGRAIALCRAENACERAINRLRVVVLAIKRNICVIALKTIDLTQADRNAKFA